MSAKLTLVREQIEQIRKALHALSNDALNLRRSLNVPRPTEEDPITSAMQSIKTNAIRVRDAGLYVDGEEDFIPWLIQRIETVERLLNKVEKQRGQHD